ncbi:MAG: hypothetical protein N2111_11195 [Candidatus Sumerlaeaceae bacterium]|nr:hypothetical protein [Candidatus Sumerlaeaceae bacterium]
MSERSFFEHYVLGGGWSMLLLVPALVVALFAGVRGLLAVRGVRRYGAEMVASRLTQLFDRHGSLSPQDVRAEVAAVVNDLCTLLLPLQAVFILAPLAAVAGSVWRVMTASVAVAGGRVEPFAAEVEQALVPLVWGVGIAALAYTFYLVNRIAILALERDVLVPAGDDIAQRLCERHGLRRRVLTPAREESE